MNLIYKFHTFELRSFVKYMKFIYSSFRWQNSRSKTMCPLLQATRSRRCVFYEKYAENHYTEFVSAYNENWTIAVSKSGKMRPGHKGRRGQRTVQFIERASKIIIQTKNVEDSLYIGLRDHIEQLLRAYRTKENAGNTGNGRKMPHPGYSNSWKRKNKTKRKEKKMKKRSQKRLQKALRKLRRKTANENHS